MTGKKDLVQLVMVAVDADRPFSSPAAFERRNTGAKKAAIRRAQPFSTARCELPRASQPMAGATCEGHPRKMPDD
jgi:hypothetical protein